MKKKNKHTISIIYILEKYVPYSTQTKRYFEFGYKFTKKIHKHEFLKSHCKEAKCFLTLSMFIMPNMKLVSTS